MSAGRGPRESLLLPVAIPVVSLLIIGVALFGFSRILLRVSHTAATVTALVAAAGIMAVAAFVTSRKDSGAPAILSLVGGVVGIAMLAGGGALLLGQPEEEGEGPFVVTVAAPLNAAADGFAQTELTAPAGEPFVIRLTSEDTVVHNVDVAPAAGEPSLASGPDVLGPGGSGDLEMEPLEAGAYAFLCKYHPTTMTGTLTVEEGVAPPGEGGVTVVASGLAFDTDTIALPADTESTITFENADAGVPHNISIFEDDSAAALIWDGPDVTGPGSVEYTVPPIAAGEYYFHCDTHPTMAGTVVVGSDPGGGTEAPTDGSEAAAPSGGG